MDVFIVVVVRLCLTRLGFSILRFCLGNGNGGGRFERGGIEDIV
jgi:hypothetical protein